jgi:hypothetical protein
MIEILNSSTFAVIAMVFTSFLLGFFIGAMIGKNKAYREELSRKAAASEQSGWANVFEMYGGQK